MNIGNHFIVGFPDSEMNLELASKLKQINPAGVILFDINFKSREQIKKLTDDLKGLLGVDLIISTDEEGGKVQRLRRFLSPLPSLRSLAKSFDSVDAFVSLLSSNLRELGFNLAYSPCADLNTEVNSPIIGNRSFGNDADLVAKQIKIFVEKLNQNSLISCAKHFPGHGATEIDSHLSLPKVKYKDEAEFKQHLKPFIAAIEANVDMVMIGHIAFDEPMPTSLSVKYIKGLLREDLKFKGVTISDEITMKALDAYGNFAERAELMIEAGNDLIIWNTNIDDALLATKQVSNFSEEALERINKLKQKTINPQTIPVNKDQLEKKILDIATKAIEIKNPNCTIANNSILIYNKHPKLERDILDRVFTMPKMEFDEAKNPCEFALDKFESIIVIEFQTALNSKLNDYICKLKAARRNTLIISTDVLSPHVDINLNGCGEAHFRALNISALQSKFAHFE